MTNPAKYGSDLADDFLDKYEDQVDPQNDLLSALEDEEITVDQLEAVTAAFVERMQEIMSTIANRVEQQHKLA